MYITRPSELWAYFPITIYIIDVGQLMQVTPPKPRPMDTKLSIAYFDVVHEQIRTTSLHYVSLLMN